ncbi:uncharacterized protein qrfp [Betta splendens]|uniref:Uncharacterized protein qrfp n=1 Tax=Betta splendens TaxID=158456 RepID=A0A8M1HKE1_BETSP|nr:uncharacterized protein qrfp [Betta splendens]
MADNGWRGRTDSRPFLKSSQTALEKMQQLRPQRKMRLSFHSVASQLGLLCLTLLSPIPHTVTSYPVFPTGPLPTAEPALVQLQAALEGPADRGFLWPTWPRDPRSDLMEPDESWENDGEALVRMQRGDLMDRLLSPFPGGLSLEMHYQEGGEGEDGGKRNEALTSIAGGLQAVSREKGGFGFRFGRKRWN